MSKIKKNPALVLPIKGAEETFFIPKFVENDITISNPAILNALKEAEKTFFIPNFDDKNITINNPAILNALKEVKFYMPNVPYTKKEEK